MMEKMKLKEGETLDDKIKYLEDELDELRKVELNEKKPDGTPMTLADLEKDPNFKKSMEKHIKDMGLNMNNLVPNVSSPFRGATNKSKSLIGS